MIGRGRSREMALCFPHDVLADVVREFCEVLKLRGEGVGANQGGLY